MSQKAAITLRDIFGTPHVLDDLFTTAEFRLAKLLNGALADPLEKAFVNGQRLREARQDLFAFLGLLITWNPRAEQNKEEGARGHT